jgi:hypothetical protein
MPTTGYIPGADRQLIDWAANFNKQVAAHATTWNITETEVADLNAAETLFADLHALVDSPAKTKTLVEQKNEARKNLVKLIRALVDFKLKNPIITNANRVELGLPVHDTTRTPIPTPTTRPDFKLSIQDIREIKIDFNDHGSDNKAKPYGCDGAVIFHSVTEQQPTSPDQLTHSTLATRTPHVLIFTEEQRGKKVFVALRWQNEKGQVGPWSEILGTIIP